MPLFRVHALKANQYKSISDNRHRAALLAPQPPSFSVLFSLPFHSSFLISVPNLDCQLFLMLSTFFLALLFLFLDCPCPFIAWLWMLLPVVPPQLPVFHQFLPFSRLLLPQLSKVHLCHLPSAFWFIAKTS